MHIRVVALAISALPIISYRSGFDRFHSVRARIYVALFGFLAGYLIYLAGATLLHGQPSEFFTRLLTIGLTVGLVWSWLKLYSPETLLQGFVLGAAVVIWASLAVGVAGDADAYEQGRLRGLLENANLLGVVCALVLLVIISRSLGSWSRTLIMVSGVWSLALTASRAGLLLLVAGLVGFALFGIGRARKFLLVALLGVVLLLFVNPATIQSVQILRTLDSRSSGILESLAVLDTYPYGLGFRPGDLGTKIAGAPFTAVVEAGWMGLGGLLVTAASLLLASRGLGRAASVFAVSAVLHAVFESWMLAPSGPMATCILLVWIGFASQAPTTSRSNDGSLSTGTRVPPAQLNRRVSERARRPRES